MRKENEMVGDKLSTYYFGLAYGNKGYGFRMEVYLKHYGIDENGNIILGADCASEGELNRRIQEMIDELEKLKEYGKKKETEYYTKLASNKETA